MGSLHFHVTTITDHRMPRGCAISVLFLAILCSNLKKINKVRHTIVQIASLLAVATDFIGLWTLMFTFYSQGGWGAYMRGKTTYAGT